MNKKNKHFILDNAHNLGLLRTVHFFDFAHASSLYVLVYHRVDWEDSQLQLDPRNLSATPRQFDQQMHLISSEYNPVSAEDVLASVVYGKKLPPRAVLVTVDDGYCDFKKYIWPISNRYGIRPVLFVPTAFIGTGIFWWDQLFDALRRSRLKHINTPIGVLPLINISERQHAFLQISQFVKRTPFKSSLVMVNELCQQLVPDPYVEDRITLDWDDLRELSNAGVTVAPHTHTHPALANIDYDQVCYEIMESQRLILTEIGTEYPLFAYPYGSNLAVGKVAGEVLRDIGCQMAFTMMPGRAHLNIDDHMYIPRIESNINTTIAQLHMKLNPFYDFIVRKRKNMN